MVSTLCSNWCGVDGLGQHALVGGDASERNANCGSQYREVQPQRQLGQPPHRERSERPGQPNTATDAMRVQAAAFERREIWAAPVHLYRGQSRRSFFTSRIFAGQSGQRADVTPRA
jgi:hypothetical protein